MVSRLYNITEYSRIILVTQFHPYPFPLLYNIFFVFLKLFLRIRKTTWQRLLTFTGGSLTNFIKELSKNDLLNPILIEEHYKAVERRLLLVFGAIDYCIDNFGYKSVLK